MMEKSQKLKQELHRLAGKFNIPESDIDEELVPLMLVLEQASSKVDQAAAKINDSVKPVTYNNNYGHNSSAWTMFWGNISSGIGHNILAISLVFSGFFLCCLGIFAFKDYKSDHEKIATAEKRLAWISRQFTQDEDGHFFIPKEHYKITSDKKGIQLLDMEQ